MSVHWKGQCYKVQNVDCKVPVETAWRKSMPKLVLKGWAKEVIFEDERAIIT
jgi:hypothetical protein